ncbi:hydantoinase/oxoprolinase family protein [Amycolatopsis rhabdoformis]|uniref:Hydantoinase/oxoprolinase family protein n=1 Tax=Amycolatopsis rhabdoformis TaxID=1448059 RepID=A0ABZ1IFE9_9PSEU|nr:hydantoinase/oxoprolinase family protein [Amycolatopsis rhabdoformis]WSE32657.1 hydantoinase/oxoprolinase family protein [Amycolatopsis rhabdoformis]
MRIGIDVGGTNTDAAVLDGERVVAWRKTATTPDVLTGVATALAAVVDQVGTSAVDAVVIGTTQFVNALVEARRLAPVVVIRLATPPQTLEPFTDWPPALVGAVRAQAHVVGGGHQFTGEPLRDLDADAVRRIARDAPEGCEFVVSGTFSPVNPDAERAARDLIRQVRPRASVTLSQEIGRLGLLERENAAVLNAALRPLAERVVTGFARALADVGLTVPLFLSQNDGTVMNLALARAYPILTISSGPTNSMRGAAFESAEADCIVADVGGTTTDIGLVQGGFPRESAIAISLAGVRTNFRIPDVVSLGIGGGSLVTDHDGRVTVGPESVGHRLTERALVFGGDTLTLTDVAVAAGLTEVGDPTRVAHLAAEFTGRVLAHVHDRIAEAVERAKLSAAAIPLIGVGGGAFVVGDDIPGVSAVLRPGHAAVANAVGAATADVGAEVDRIYSLAERTREDVLDEARRTARDRAAEAGAVPGTVRIVDEEDLPLAYLQHTTRVRVRAVGDLGTLAAAEEEHSHAAR